MISVKNFVESFLIKLGLKKRKEVIYIITGPSGAGKTTLGKYLKSLNIPELVSCTTRKMRKGEIQGIHYNFISKKKYDKLDKIEYTEYADNFYCLTRKEVTRKLKKYSEVFAVTDIEGVNQIKNKFKEKVKVIYIYTPLDEMKDRMKLRGDKEENIEERLEYAKLTGEFRNYIYADYIIENMELEKSKERLAKIISINKGKHLEIERKFLVNHLPDLSDVPHCEIRQGYLDTEIETRIRKQDNEYYKTIKSEGDMVREEIETIISEEEFNFLSKQVVNNFVEKTRYYLLEGSNVIELDIYKNELNGLITAEVEFLDLKEAEDFNAPDWFDIEVTENKNYKNKNLSKYGLSKSA
ncbi:MAG: gmk [Clostridiaceae bacterium]|jgi:guanylate kinase|nr:gmk [Clostridiaceae bacterium]